MANLRVRFGPFEWEPSAGELYRAGERLRLQEQPRQILATLLERPGDVITRDELRERLWKAETFVDFEHGLNTAVKKVRQALGDSAENPAFVETLAKRGYRFIAPLSSEAPASAAVPSPPMRAPVLKADLRLLVAAVAIVVALVVGALWVGSRNVDEAASSLPAGSPEPRLAVLPLRVLGDRASDQYLGVGVADAIVTRLSAIRQVALRPTTATLPFADTTAPPQEVAAELDVGHLLVGTIQPAPSAHRVSLQLVRGSDGVVVWARAYDVTSLELPTFEDVVAEQVANALAVQLTPDERKRLHRRYIGDPDAYAMYLRGRALLVNYTEANMRDAIASFEQAVTRDPRNALVHAGLATAAAWFSVRYAYEPEAMAWGRRAENHAEAALKEDGSLAEAHLAIASAAGTAFRNFDWSRLLEESDAALALDPQLELAHVARMRALYHLGEFDRARTEAEQARRINPSPNVETARLSVVLHLFAGDFDRARSEAEALLARTDAPAVRNYLGLARYYLGDVHGARAMLSSARRGSEPDVRSQAALASVLAATGERAEATRLVTVIENGAYMDHHVAYSLGAALAQLDRHDDAMQWLERAVDTGFPCYPWLKQDPLLQPLRNSPAFTRLLETARRAAVR